MQLVILTFVSILTFYSFTFASQPKPIDQKIAKPVMPLSIWFPLQVNASKQLLLKNISPADAYPGAVIASPSKSNPNYYYHWTRDAALVMEVVRKFSPRSSVYDQMLRDYTAFSRLNQLSNALSGLGEPKYEVNGQPYNGPWGRPQNDGPALRAITLTQWALDLLERGQIDYVKTWLYRAELPANTVIKSDLEFVAHNWQKPNFDLWEEVLADHFYTLMVQRKAMVLGEKLARAMNDTKAGDFYLLQMKAINAKLEKFWDNQKQFILTSLNYAGGLDAKKSNLDIAVVLAVLHSEVPGMSFSIQDARVAKTVDKLIAAFAQLYPINFQNPQYAPAIGRYTEDVYSGNGFDGGNPWFLTTLALSEYYFLKAKSQTDTREKKRLRDIGISFLERVQMHSPQNFHLSEQISRTSGYMLGAENLTWSHAAILTTHMAFQ